MNTEAYTRFIDCATQRYSCRAYDPDATVSDDDIRAVIEGARLAPSACNRQPWTFVVVRDASARRTLLAKSRPAFLDAPVLIVACGHHDTAWHRPADNKDHTDVDLSIAIEHLCLAASAAGLGTCWVCNFDVEATRSLLNLPADVEPIALIPLGHALGGSNAPEKSRKPLDEILRWEKY